MVIAVAGCMHRDQETVIGVQALSLNWYPSRNLANLSRLHGTQNNRLDIALPLVLEEFFSLLLENPLVHMYQYSRVLTIS